MKTLFYSTFLFLLASCTWDNEEATDRIDLSPPSCDLSVIAASPFHQKHLRFAKLLALCLDASPLLREAVKNASLSPGQQYFNEILIQDFLNQPVGNNSVEGILSQKFNSSTSLSEGMEFSTFKTDLLAADPLLTIKIPDWFWDVAWDTQTETPHVVSNIKGSGEYLYGFDGTGNCFSKQSYFDATKIEVVVKTSEDYLWVEGPEFLHGFANPCMSYDSFFNAYARSYAGHFLLKKRDMQKLFLSCAPPGPEGPPNPPLVPCKRDEGMEHNYMLGFELANADIIYTLQNQPCLGGEETLDFQIDFVYAYRTAENAAVDAQLPPLPLYGLRWKDLVDIQFNPPWAGGIQISTKYYPLSIGAMKYDFMKHINPIDDEWNRSLMGEALYVTWNETDFQICTSVGVQTVTNTIGATLNLKLPFSWVPGGTFNTNYSQVSSHTVNVTGAAVIPLGYNALGYCDPQTPGIPPAQWYPTGPQGLNVHFDYVFD